MNSSTLKATSTATATTDSKKADTNSEKKKGMYFDLNDSLDSSTGNSNSQDTKSNKSNKSDSEVGVNDEDDYD